jgi:CBS domain-containing protein
MYEFLEYKVADAMTRDPVTIGRKTTLAEVEALFEEHDFNGLPVCEDGALVGIVTKLDALKAFAFGTQTMVPHYDEIMRQPAETVMTTQPITVHPGMNLTRVLQLMSETRYKSFPVVLDAQLVGVIAREDVLRALRRAAAGERPADTGAGSGRVRPR